MNHFFSVRDECRSLQLSPASRSMQIAYVRMDRYLRYVLLIKVREKNLKLAFTRKEDAVAEMARLQMPFENYDSPVAKIRIKLKSVRLSDCATTLFRHWDVHVEWRSIVYSWKIGEAPDALKRIFARMIGFFQGQPDQAVLRFRVAIDTLSAPPMTVEEFIRDFDARVAISQ